MYVILVVVIPNGYNWESILGLLNLSLTWPINARGDIDISSRREWSKKHALSLSEGSALSPAQTQGRQDALFHGQGRSQFDARSVLTVRERERREERQVCEPEGQAQWRERRWRLFSTFPSYIFWMGSLCTISVETAKADVEDDWGYRRNCI
ncbi:MAG: hypothetical protein VST68_01990 [Nitrospirota bacterium]|nr:hypothetical protein [Nitrospirota bacterium]